METAVVEGNLAAVVAFDYDMSKTGGPKGTSWSAWVVPDFGAEPLKIKLPEPSMWNDLLEAGFGASCSIAYTLSANVKGQRAVIERRASAVKLATASRSRKAA